jgi:hypothetical protein
MLLLINLLELEINVGFGLHVGEVDRLRKVVCSFEELGARF